MFTELLLCCGGAFGVVRWAEDIRKGITYFCGKYFN